MTDPDEQSRLVVAALRSLLGAAVLGVYLHGSSVLGGLKPHSDVDLMAVTTRPMGDDEKRTLLHRLLHISRAGRPGWDRRPIELLVLVQDRIRPWRYPPDVDLLYGDWWRAEYERGEFPWTSPNPDLTIQIDMALRADHPVFGPPLTTLLDAVPPADVRRAMLDSLSDLLTNLDGDEANVLLTLARTWYSLVTGSIAPKDSAADWAIERLPPADRTILAHARSIYLCETADDWTGLEPRIRGCVDRLLVEIERVAEGRPGAV
jgi:predicted nucleotidyltransferase